MGGAACSGASAGGRELAGHLLHGLGPGGDRAVGIEHGIGTQGAPPLPIRGIREQHHMDPVVLQAAHERPVDSGHGGGQHRDLAQAGKRRGHDLAGIGTPAGHAHRATGRIQQRDELGLAVPRNREQHPADHGWPPSTGITTRSRSPARAPSTRDKSARGTSTWAPFPPLAVKMDSVAMTSATMSPSASKLGSSSAGGPARYPGPVAAVSHRSTMLPLVTPGGIPPRGGTVTGRRWTPAASPSAPRGTSSPAGTTRTTTASGCSGSVTGR